MKNITYSIHAMQRLIERNITRYQIEKVIINPDYTIKRVDQEIEAYKEFSARTLKVVFIEKESYIKVITIYWV